MLCPFDPNFHPGSTRPPGTVNGMFDAIEPVLGVPDACKLESMGTGDGEKHICMGVFPPTTASSDSCSIISIGSNNEYEYEEDIFDHMPCEIHVFDCTVQNPTPPQKLAKSPRFFFHKLCVGAEDDKDKSTATWKTMAMLASHNAARPILSLKMDIEGWEFEALRQLANPEMARLRLIPMQIAAEVHQMSLVRYNPPQYRRTGPHSPYCTVTTEQIRDLVVTLMSTQGYLLADRNDNPLCDTCSEVVFIHVNMYGLTDPINFYSSNHIVTSNAAVLEAHLANLLNIPSLYQKHHHGYRTHAPVRTGVSQFESGSILALYQQSEIDMKLCSSFLDSFSPCPSLPMKEILVEAMKRYENGHHMHTVYSPLSPSLIESEHTLAVHMRLGDRDDLDQTLVEVLDHLLREQTALKQIIIQGSADFERTDQTSQTQWTAACRLESAVRALRKRFGDRISYHVPQSGDEDLFLLSRSKNLLVHGGIHSAFIAIVATGKVYIPEKVMLDYSREFYQMLPSGTTIIAQNGTAIPVGRFMSSLTL
ncbi:hypothetical protein EON65_28080 [archaeon]|nr:MAG: hypothetical protein EON65_28080 [archaeon]